MEINKNNANEPTVGIKFFESISPVVLENYSSRWNNRVDLAYGPNSTENTKTKRGTIQLNEPQGKAVVEGFGSTALFTTGLLDFNILTEEQRQKLVNHHGQVLMIEDT